jgi:hypothetical protein
MKNWDKIANKTMEGFMTYILTNVYISDAHMIPYNCREVFGTEWKMTYKTGIFIH